MLMVTRSSRSTHKHFQHYASYKMNQTSVTVLEREKHVRFFNRIRPMSRGVIHGTGAQPSPLLQRQVAKGHQ
jgi:hypothetical protein